MEDLKALKEERNKIVHDLREIVDKADKEERAVTAEEREQFDKMEAKTDELDKRIGELEDQMADEERKRRLAEREERLNESEVEPIKPDPEDEIESRDDKKSDDVERRASDEYLEDFRAILKEGLSRVETRALQMDEDTAGGFTIVPQKFLNKLIKQVDDALPFRTLATIIPLKKAGSLGVPVLDPRASRPVWGGEITTPKEETTLGFKKRELRTHRLSQYIKVSNELLDNSAIPIEDVVANELQYHMARTQEEAFMTGNGNNQPLGILVNDNQGLTTGIDTKFAKSNAFDADTLVDCKYALKPQYWGKARWIMHRYAIRDIRKLKDSEGNYLWQPGITADRPDTIVATPVIASEYASTAFSSSNYGGIIGDFSYYWIAEARNIGIRRLVELYAINDQTGFVIRSSVDGMPVLEEAFRRLRF